MKRQILNRDVPLTKKQFIAKNIKEYLFAKQ